MAKILTKGLIGLQDLSIGFGTFARATSTGGTQNLTQIAATARGAVLVGSEFNTYYGTSDIGAQINAAYAALPATGGLIYITPQSPNVTLGSQPYTFTTPIVFGTPGKLVGLKGLAPGGYNPSTGAYIGTVLDYTPTAGQSNDTLTQCGPVAFVLTGVTISGSNAVYAGTITGGASGVLIGVTVAITGFVTSTGVNNITGQITAATATSITLTKQGSQVNESHAGLATNHARSVYVGTLANGISNGYAGRMVNITGFQSAAGNSGLANNGYFSVAASSSTAMLVFNGYCTAETHSATAQTCQPAILYENTSNSIGDGYVPSQFIEDIVLQNNTTALTNFGNGYSTIGVDFTGAGRLNLNRVSIAGFGVNACFNASNGVSNTFGAQFTSVALTQANLGLAFIEGMENFNWNGGSLAVNTVGCYSAGGDIAGTLHINGVSLDSNLFPLRDHWGGSVWTLTNCHFENNGQNSQGAVSYIYSESSAIQVFGGFLLDDFAGGTAPIAWFNVGPTVAFSALTVIGLNFFSAGRFPSTAGFVGTSAVYVQGVNGNANMTNLVSGPITQTINFTQANQSAPGISIGPSMFLGADPGQASIPTPFTAQLRVGGQVAASQGFATTGAGVTLSSGAHNVGIATNASLFHLRDTSNGGSCLVLVDNTSTNVVIVSSAGTSSHFTTGSPTNQIGLSYSSSFLVATANGTAVNAVLLFTQIMTQ